ncbi:kinase-like domain-containing protein [Lipomyces oligophaga]|uniref:kinase-like domain-containing protein n=1 Tax=Lipomyces oligophaga TaxID=45792 RepID=UPI0034CF9E85
MSWKLTKKLRDTHLSTASSRSSSTSTLTPANFREEEKREKREEKESKDKSKEKQHHLHFYHSSKHEDAHAAASEASTVTSSPLSNTSSARSSASGFTPGHRSTPSTTSTVRPGLLAVTIHEATGLSLPPSYTHAHHGQSLASQFSLTNDSSRKFLPYMVVEFDKTQVILDAHSGTIEAPKWDQTANFDVSRAETLTLSIYVRNPGAFFSSKPENGNSSQEKARTDEDILLGSCKVVPKLDARAGRLDENVAVSWGTGKVHFEASFKPNQNTPLTIDDFDLLKVVGKGSFGKVMQVRKKDTSRIYALKTIRKAHIISRSEVTHTLAERTVLAQIDNPFIVPLKFSFQSPEKLYLVLAFINGGELFHHLQREGIFELNRARFYTAELLCALECLHEFNVIYRDLKPENILLDYTGHIALCDFGLCKLNMRGDEKTNTFCGTPEYLAPELLLGQGYTKTVDWWTLGVLLYEMLTGLPPFYDENTNDMYRKILQEPLRFPEEMDKDARSLLTGLLNRDPNKRLGANGAEEIKNHKFFAEIDWKKLLGKKYPPPFKPSVASATDTSNFDTEFTNEVPTDSVVNDYLSESIQRQFGGWTYSDNRLATTVGTSAGPGPGSVIG